MCIRDRDPIAHLEGGNFSNNPTDEITDYIEMQWAEFTAGGWLNF